MPISEDWGARSLLIGQNDFYMYICSLKSTNMEDDIEYMYMYVHVNSFVYFMQFRLKQYWVHYTSLIPRPIPSFC